MATPRGLPQKEEDCNLLWRTPSHFGEGPGPKIRSKAILGNFYGRWSETWFCQRIRTEGASRLQKDYGEVGEGSEEELGDEKGLEEHGMFLKELGLSSEESDVPQGM